MARERTVQVKEVVTVGTPRTGDYVGSGRQFPEATDWSLEGDSNGVLHVHQNNEVIATFSVGSWNHVEWAPEWPGPR